MSETIEERKKRLPTQAEVSERLDRMLKQAREDEAKITRIMEMRALRRRLAQMRKRLEK